MKVFKNYLLNSAYQLLLVFIPLITIPYISRILGDRGIGLNAFTLAIVQYFILAGSIGITTYGNREIAYNQGDKKKRSQIFWEISFLRFFTIALSISAFVVFLSFQTSNFYIYLLQGIAILAAAFDISWYFMGMENFKRTVTRNFMVSLLSIVLIFLFVNTVDDLPLYILIVTGSALIGNLSLWPFLTKEIFGPDWRNLKIQRHLYPTLMLFLPQIATQVYIVVNKNMIGIFDSIIAVGFFAQSDSITRVSLALVTSLGTVMLPHVSSMHAKGDLDGIKKMLEKSFDVMTGLSIPIMFGIMAISLNFAPLFFGVDFRVVGVLMMMQAPIIVAIAWSNVLGVQYLLPLNKMRQFTTSVTIGAILNVILNLVLLPIFGVFGAMFATILAEFSVTIYQMRAVRNEIKIKRLFGGVWKYFFSGFIMFLVVFGLNQYWPSSYIALIIQVIIGFLIYLLMNILFKTTMYQEVRGLALSMKKKEVR